MEPILTTGGLYTEEVRRNTIKTICQVFSCKPEDIEDVKPVQEGMTNIVLSFLYNGGKYVFRYPGLGANEMVNRGRESIMQKIVEDAGIDTTLVAMNVEAGWKISKFVENRKFEYHDLNDMVRAVMLLRTLHETPAKVRWDFDVIQKAEELKEKIAPEFYGTFEAFEELRDRVYKLAELAKQDGIRYCNVHGDARDVNFLINKDEIYLIDWEYAGYGDPGFDLGSYICGGDHSREEVDRILFIYCGREPSFKQKRHFYAYIAITGWFYMHWTMFKESCGQVVGIHKQLWYQFAVEYSKLAMPMYEEEK